MTNYGTLYRMYSASGELLYVGKSVQPLLRMYQHKNNKEWFTEVSRIHLTHFPIDQLDEMEVSAIRAERPKYNIANKTMRIPAPNKYIDADYVRDIINLHADLCDAYPDRTSMPKGDYSTLNEFADAYLTHTEAMGYIPQQPYKGKAI